MSPREETVIVGGGPAGMLLAYLLVEAGERVHLLERHPDFHREFRGEGIQLSVLRLLRQLGLLDTLLAEGIARPAHAARIHLDDRPLASLEGDGDDPDFGLILFQSRFLDWLHARLEATGRYRATFSAVAEDFVYEDGPAAGVVVRQGHERQTIRGRDVVVAAGRGTGLRGRLGIPVTPVDTHFNILWMRLPPPANPALVPDGFRAYLTGDAVFILYLAGDGGLQMAWGRRDERGLKAKDFETRRRLLLADAPAPLRPELEAGFTPETRTQFLRVQSDRAERWYAPGVLLIGDAAHTMSPVGGQGINLAMRDAVVAANLLLEAHAEGHGIDDALGRRFQALRQGEVAAMQTFQRQLGYFMLGAPRWQIQGFFRLALPVLGALGIRRRLLERVQQGVTEVRFAPPHPAPAPTGAPA